MSIVSMLRRREQVRDRPAQYDIAPEVYADIVVRAKWGTPIKPGQRLMLITPDGHVVYDRKVMVEVMAYVLNEEL